MIGVAVGKRAVAGVVHQPYYNYKSEIPGVEMGRTMWGIVGAGIGGMYYIFLYLFLLFNQRNYLFVYLIQDLLPPLLLVKVEL